MPYVSICCTYQPNYSSTNHSKNKKPRTTQKVYFRKNRGLGEKKTGECAKTETDEADRATGLCRKTNRGDIE